MMYNNALTACIKVNGKVLRESKDQVYIPFGSEYSISIKNLNSVRASVNVQVDGVDATDGRDLVIHPNDSIDLQRFIKNGNLSQGNAFKFIERTAGIEAHKGIGSDDGLIRIEFKFEKQKPVTKVVDHIIHEWHQRPYPYHTEPYRLGQPLFFGNNKPVAQVMGLAQNSMSVSNTSTYSATLSSTAQSDSTETQLNAVAQIGRNMMRGVTPIPQNDVGITVPGSIQNQQFTVVDSFETEEQSHVIILRLLGSSDTGKKVQQAVTVKTKPKCISCGKVNKASSKFCTNCGTSLTLI